MSNPKSSVISFPSDALLNKSIEKKAHRHDVLLKINPRGVASCTDYGSERWNGTVGLLRLLEDNQIAYDQTIADIDTELTVTSVRFFNGDRSSKCTTSKDAAISGFIYGLLDKIDDFEDVEELKMYLQTQAFFMSKPLLIQGTDIPPIE